MWTEYQFSRTLSKHSSLTYKDYFSVFGVNLLFNGDAETGPCNVIDGVTSPTGWNYDGPITQAIYNNDDSDFLLSTDPGPR